MIGVFSFACISRYAKVTANNIHPILVGLTAVSCFGWKNMLKNFFC